MCTLVTAYYEIPSKFSRDRYMAWATTFLALEAPIVLFTDAPCVDAIREKRGSRPLHLVVLPFAELETWAYRAEWVAHHALDPEKAVHSPELYAIWAEKAFFVHKAIQLNPFHTDFFFWCDIGAFRDPSVPRAVLDSFPSTAHLKRDKLLLQAIAPMCPADYEPQPDALPGKALTSTWNECRLVGGLWGGGVPACLRWKQAYHDMLLAYFAANRFAGKDQPVMFSALLRDPSLADVVTCTKSGIDSWFFLEHLLSKSPERYVLDTTYPVGN